jgi:hypothetical protein
MAGRSRREAAITMPGTTLSPEPISTMPSKRCPSTMSSIMSATTSRLGNT